MSKVLILSKTKMQENRVCVGAVDLDNRCSIRLLNCDGHHETIDECPYEILAVWDIVYRRTNRRPAPHLEDVNVLERSRTAHTVKSQELLKLPSYNIKVFNSSLLNVFDEKLNSTERGSLYISNEKGVPEYSTCFWQCDKDLRKNRFSTEQKVKYDYRDNEGRWYHITYVGLENVPEVIRAGSMIRLSLAHWWHPDDTDTENRCYLQLSGVFNIE